MASETAIEGEIITAKNIHISFSEFALFNECAHRHLIENHLRIYTRPPSIHLYFGNAIHSAIEHTIKEGLNLEQRVNHFRTLFQKNMMDEMKDTEDYKRHFPSFIEQGEAILRVLKLDEALKNYDVVGVEIKLYENIYDNYYFKGFIDLVLKHKVTGRYKMIDWKSSTVPWDIDKKLADRIFACQMKFYKFFLCKKLNIPLNEMDCAYVVLNRLKDKKDSNSYPGTIQNVPITVEYKEIKEATEKLAVTVKKIHQEKEFLKVKFIGSERMGCKFCPLKGDIHPLCDRNPEQYKKLLAKHKNALARVLKSKTT